MTRVAPFQLLPALHDEEVAELRASIREHGIRVPILLDTAGNVIDGHHRQAIAAELDIDPPVQVLAPDVSDDEKRQLALTLNLARRHLTRQQRRDLVTASLTADPGLSDRSHAHRTGTDHKTVASQRRHLETTGEIPHSRSRRSRDGRQRPATPREPQTAPGQHGEAGHPTATGTRLTSALEALTRSLRTVADLAQDCEPSATASGALELLRSGQRQLADLLDLLDPPDENDPALTEAAKAIGERTEVTERTALMIARRVRDRHQPRDLVVYIRCIDPDDLLTRYAPPRSKPRAADECAHRRAGGRRVVGRGRNASRVCDRCEAEDPAIPEQEGRV